LEVRGLIEQWEYEQRMKSLDRYSLNFEMAMSRKKGRMTEKLGDILIDLSTRIISRYKISEDLKQDAINNGALKACMYWDRFNPERADDAWPYMIQIIKSSFAGFYKKEYDYKAKIEIDPTLTIPV